MKKRFLFSSVAGYGHLHPLMPLARALREAGHEVAFAGSEALQEKFEGIDMPFVLTRIDRNADPDYQAIRDELDKMPVGLETEIYAYPRLFMGIGARVGTSQLVEACRSWGADVVVNEAGSYRAVMAAEHLGLPHVTVAVAASLKGMTVFEREGAKFLDPTREAFGLEPDPKMDALTRYLLISFSPPSFSTHELGPRWQTGEIPATTHYVRPDFYDTSAGESLPAWIDDLPDQPTVYLTLGTEINREPTLYPRVMKTLIDGLRDVPINLIVTLGKGQDPEVFGPQPENVHIKQYIPQSLLLPKCDLMVMHGGTNTLLQAIDAGLPTVIVPLIADQFFNAEVAEAMGMSRVVQDDQLTPASICEVVEEVLGNPKYRENVERLQGEMHALPGIEYGVELVEQVAAERRPIIEF